MQWDILIYEKNLLYEINQIGGNIELKDQWFQYFCTKSTYVLKK